MVRKHACDILNIDRKWLWLISHRYWSQSKRFLRQRTVRLASISWITTGNMKHRFRWWDKSDADFCSDSSRLHLEALNPSTVSRPKRVDIPVIVHTTSVSIVCLLRVRVFLERKLDWTGNQIFKHLAWHFSFLWTSPFFILLEINYLSQTVLPEKGQPYQISTRHQL